MQRLTSDRLIQRVRTLREQVGLTQEEFAERASMSYKYYQALEAGRKRDLRFSTLTRLADAFGIQLWELFSPDLPSFSKLRRKKP